MANVSPTDVSPADQPADQLANLRLDDATADATDGCKAADATDGGNADDAKADATDGGNLTPAGGQINVSWGESTDAIRCLATFLSNAVDVDVNDEWHVVFRCGTVVRVSPTDKEFGGFDDGEYEWPEHRSEHTDTVSDVMDDNKLVWSNQRKIPGPAGKAIRQGFAKMIKLGYPYPGGDISDRYGIPTGVEIKPCGMLHIMFWPNLDKTNRVYNVAFSTKGLHVAVDIGGELRRYDYMFPEVAAVFSPRIVAWSYGPDGSFSDKHPL
jgi:hypothetical protein